MRKKLKLVFYSGGQLKKNQMIHREMLELVSPKRKKRMTYIPFCEDGSKSFFERFKKRYKPFGGEHFICLPVDKYISKKDLCYGLDTDIIYLAGGNTFYFLYHLKKSGLLPKLRDFANQGGIIAGLSAGAIMITPNIEMAAYPPYDPDENDVGLKKLNALNLVDFEFYPHFVNSKRVTEDMMMYSLISKNKILACEDGGGLVLNGEKKVFFGKPNYFYQGKRLVL